MKSKEMFEQNMLLWLQNMQDISAWRSLPTAPKDTADVAATLTPNLGEIVWNEG